MPQVTPTPTTNPPPAFDAEEAQRLCEWIVGKEKFYEDKYQGLSAAPMRLFQAIRLLRGALAEIERLRAELAMQQEAINDFREQVR